jgi:hypothetical protein
MTTSTDSGRPAAAVDGDRVLADVAADRITSAAVLLLG